MKATNKSSDVTPPTDGSKATNRQISLLAISELVPASDNPRKHDRQQVRAIARSIKAFDFNAPIMVDRNRQIIAGHGRYEAAKLLGLAQVPVVFLDHLTETQAKAYRLADNKLTDRSRWDDTMVAAQLKELADLVLDFDIEAIGFELPELDVRIQSLDDPDVVDNADEFDAATGPAVSLLGDLWLLGPHRLYCGNALDSTSYIALMNGEKAAAVFTDQPYNVKIDGNVCGSGRITHREFAMASGEMTEVEFTEFLTTGFRLMRAHSASGALIYGCMDFRHMWEMLTAGRAAEMPLLNLCVWSKTNAGMGSFYRSQHELVFVFRNATARKPISTTSSSAASGARGRIYGRIPASAGSPAREQRTFLPFTPPSNRLPWFPTRSSTAPSAAMLSWTLSSGAAPQFWLPSAPVGDVSASRSIRSTSTPPSPAGSG
jgi:hypothetical protein